MHIDRKGYMYPKFSVHSAGGKYIRTRFRTSSPPIVIAAPWHCRRPCQLLRNLAIHYIHLHTSRYGTTRRSWFLRLFHQSNRTLELETILVCLIFLHTTNLDVFQSRVATLSLINQYLEPGSEGSACSSTSNGFSSGFIDRTLC